MAPTGFIPSTDAEIAAEIARVSGAPPELPPELKPFANLAKPAVADLEHPTPNAEVPISDTMAMKLQPLSDSEMAGTVETLTSHGIPAAAVEYIAKGGGCAPFEHQFALDEKARLMSDADFMAKWMAGDKTAEQTMAKIAALLSYPVLEGEALAKYLQTIGVKKP